jgi:hypothetical protein
MSLAGGSEYPPVQKKAKKVVRRLVLGTNYLLGSLSHTGPSRHWSW